MPPFSDSPAFIVARFLRTNAYPDTLATFICEAGLPLDAGSSFPGALSVEQILTEKKAYDLSANFEKLGVDDTEKKWTIPAPSAPTVIELPTTANLLQSSVEYLHVGGESGHAQPLILASTADRRLNILFPDAKNLVRSHTQLQDSPILSYTVVGKRFLICSSMSGRVVVYDSQKDQLVVHRKDHAKYVVHVTSWESGDHVWLATAGWDQKVLLYECRITEDSMTLENPVGIIQLASNPEALLFRHEPDSDCLYLLVTRRDSTFVYYYQIAEDQLLSSVSKPVIMPISGKQNLAPLSNAWVAFSPAAMSASPSDPNLIAIATSSVPHMKLLVVKLLYPPATATDKSAQGGESVFPQIQHSSPADVATTTEAAQQARAALAVQDREVGAILVHCNTLSPQSAYSTPTLAWRPDGSGVWVNSDDGTIRGIETSTGKIVAKLQGHEPGSKIRCLSTASICLGEVESKTEEWVLSGGFDQSLILWKTRP
ncbi:hypothetical protein E2P81_ATG00764 [Venturia nashicola]|uniref:LisH domain-containing protein n=1 Tax=Venturia nashicola TaxID=86259 RepID=A0A4Z1PTG2_9PEZI|nr:hypothetical protein E6O75_ATG00782 [Venturia nashicola]TLD38221.1 hypothetical protein E2P81_ATG00764 [Venturia nashicola]